MFVIFTFSHIAALKTCFLRFSSVLTSTLHLDNLENTFAEPRCEKVKTMEISRILLYVK